MPLVRIELLQGRSEAQVQAISGAVQAALVETMNVPARDRFQVISEHAPNRFLYDKSYLGIERTDGIAQYLVLPREEWK